MLKLWGHRGCRGEGNPPEHSLAAFRRAIEQGADGIELDVFRARDGRLAVLHHDEAKETIAAAQARIAARSCEELGCADLEEVLDLAREKALPSRPEFTVNIEIKGSDDSPELSDAVTRLVADAVAKRLGHNGWTAEHFLVSSFHMNSLRRMQRLLPEIRRGALYASPAAPWDIAEDALAARLIENSDINPYSVGITLPSMTKKAAALIRAAGAVPIAWSWNEARPGLDTMLPEGRPEVIITDYPGEMRQVLEHFHNLRAAYFPLSRS